MSRALTATDRKNLIRLASALPKGSDERRAILAGLKQAAANPRQIADQMIRELEADSGAGIGSLTVFPKYRRALEKAISSLQKEGLVFSPDVVEEIALGEYYESEEKFGGFRGWREISRVLGEIFDGDGGEWGSGL